MGISPGTEFKLFETAAGKIAAPVCMDASYFETFRILELQDAEIVIIPIANPEPYNYWLALRGIWPRVQECPVYGIKSALVGNLLGFSFTGRAGGIFAPAELTPDGSGVLTEVASPEAEGIAVAEIDLDELQKLRREHPWRDSNPPMLYRRYFPPHAYRSISRGQQKVPVPKNEPPLIVAVRNIYTFPPCSKIFSHQGQGTLSQQYFISGRMVTKTKTLSANFFGSLYGYLFDFEKKGKREVRPVLYAG